MTDTPHNDPVEDQGADQPETVDGTGSLDNGESGATTAADATDATEDLGAGAFDVPGPTSTDAGTSADDPSDGDAADEGDQGATAGEEHDDKPRKAYLGRPELAPLYAMAGLADLAAATVREIANEQIAAYRARRTKGEGGSDTRAEDEATESAADANAQFNAFLTKAQQRTQEIFDQAVAQYEQLADRGRVAVGEAIENARSQQRSRTPEDIVGMKPEDVSAAAQKAADKISSAVQTAAERVSRAAAESADDTTGVDDPTTPPTAEPTPDAPSGTGDDSTPSQES